MKPANQDHLGPSAFNLTDKHIKSERIQVLEDQVSGLKTQLAGFMHTQEALAQEILALRTQQAETETHRMHMQTENHAYVDRLYHQLEAKREHFELIMKDSQHAVAEKCTHLDEELDELRLETYDMREYMQELPKETVLDFMMNLKSAVSELKTGTRQLKRVEEGFNEQLPVIRSNLETINRYMQEFPMRRLPDMSLRGLTCEGELADLKTRLLKLESKSS
jgi:chromosome segregation ATPase